MVDVVLWGSLKSAAGGKTKIEVEAANIRQLLTRLGEAYPAIVRLANGNWIIVSGAGEGPDGEQMVSVIDPLAERRHEPLDVGKDALVAVEPILPYGPDGGGIIWTTSIYIGITS